MRKGLRRGALSCVADVLRWHRGPAEREGGARAHGDRSRHDHRLNMARKWIVRIPVSESCCYFCCLDDLVRADFPAAPRGMCYRDDLAVGDGGHTASPINSTTFVARDRMRV